MSKDKQEFKNEEIKPVVEAHKKYEISVELERIKEVLRRAPTEGLQVLNEV